MNEKGVPKASKKVRIFLGHMDVMLTYFQSSKDAPKFKLKLAEHDVSYRDIEELDLVDEPLEVESPYTASQQYPPTPGVLPIEGKPGSVRISKTVPQFSYASGSQPDLSLIGHFDDHNRSSPDFPLPSELLGNEDPFSYGQNEELPLFSTFSLEQSGPLALTDTASLVTENCENNAFDFNAFEALEKASHAHASLNKKRAASTTPLQPEAKIRRVIADKQWSKVVEENDPGTVREEVVPEREAKRPLPDWVAEIDQDLIAFFGDSVVYAE